MPGEQGFSLADMSSLYYFFLARLARAGRAWAEAQAKKKIIKPRIFPPD
jgi:hypothetical protein